MKLKSSKTKVTTEEFFNLPHHPTNNDYMSTSFGLLLGLTLPYQESSALGQSFDNLSVISKLQAITHGLPTFQFTTSYYHFE